MAFTGSILDTETARKASQGILFAANQGWLVDANLSSLATAQAAVTAAVALEPQIDQQLMATRTNRALQVASNLGGNVTGSSLATLYASLPDNNSRALVMY